MIVWSSVMLHDRTVPTKPDVIGRSNLPPTEANSTCTGTFSKSPPRREVHLEARCTEKWGALRNEPSAQLASRGLLSDYPSPARILELSTNCK